MKSPAITSAVLLAVLGATAAAQYGVRGGFGVGYGGPQFTGGGSTIAGSEMTGMANVISAAGQANLQSSEAAINYEEARKANLDNRLKYTETYFEMRRMNKAYMDAERGSPVTREQAFRMARVGVPSRPKSSQLDPLTGSINWPPQLGGKKYDMYRQQLERLFSERAGGTNSVFGEIQNVTTELQADLKANIKDFKAADYVVAKRFVESLNHESRFAME